MLSHLSMVGEFAITNITRDHFQLLTVPVIFPRAWHCYNRLALLTLEGNVHMVDLVVGIQILNSMKCYVGQWTRCHVTLQVGFIFRSSEHMSPYL